MTQLRFISEAGRFDFDGAGTILSRFDVEYPQITRGVLLKNGLCGAEQLSPQLGAGRITVEGYILPGRLSVADGKRELSRIASAGGEFILWADGLTRDVAVESLKFDSSTPFASGEAEHFTLKLVSADPFFNGAEETFVGERDVRGGIYFPIAITDAAAGTFSNSGGVVIVNRGDAVRGFVAELDFPSDAVAFTLRSDRQDGVFAVTRAITAGERIVLDTRFGRKSVTDGDGVSLLGELDKQCVFFHAYPGETTLRWRSLAGESPTVRLSFTPGYLTV